MRYSHSSFIHRFRAIASRDLSTKPRFGRPKLTSDRLLTLLSERLEIKMREMGGSNIYGIQWGVQIGKTKVFLRELAFAALEELRVVTINTAATKLQSRVRSHLCQARFFLILGSVITLQCATRKLLACIRVFRMRSTSRAIVIQKHWRSYSSWSSYQNVLYISTWCQRFWRGGKVRACFSSIKEYRAAIKLQSFWRSCIQSLVHREVREAAIAVQCAFRVYIAKNVIRLLRKEARDVSLIVRERDQLRLEMKRMRLELEEIKRNQTGFSGSSICISNESSKTQQIDPSIQSQPQEVKMLRQECARKDRELKELQERFDSLSGNKSVPSTLPTTVTISLNDSTPQRSYTQIHKMASNLLDLEWSHISANENSFDGTIDNDRLPSLHLSSDSIVNGFTNELPIHHAIETNDKHKFLGEIERSSNIDLDINSIDLLGRYVLIDGCVIVLLQRFLSQQHKLFASVSKNTFARCSTIFQR
jgi:myosin heavy subunit